MEEIQHVDERPDWRDLQAASPAERDVTRAIRQSLDGETLTLKWFVAQPAIAEGHSPEARAGRHRSALALDWWKGNAHSGVLAVLGTPYFRGLPPPVFCTLSLCLRGLAPSLHVLVRTTARDTAWLAFATRLAQPFRACDFDAPASSWRTAAVSSRTRS